VITLSGFHCTKRFRAAAADLMSYTLVDCEGSNSADHKSSDRSKKVENSIKNLIKHKVENFSAFIP
jgi:hypothetical protein